MKPLRFEWNEDKVEGNLRKHKISFEEAKTVFHDENARIIPDPEHSEQKERFILMGMSAGLKMLVVCHCYRESEEVIRIISARKATKQEASFY